MQGSTVFTKITNEPMVLNNGNHYCATSGDYDNDGDLDLYISGNNDNGLYENTTTQKDFINIRLVGNISNKSGIGSKVRVKANGFWQMREISSQNTFNGMNMLNAHFGFGNSGPVLLNIDSIIIEWSLGTVDICTNIFSNIFYTAHEGQCLTPTAINKEENSINTFSSISLYPNPANDNLNINFTLTESSNLEAIFLDETGKIVLNKILLKGISGSNNVSIDIRKLKSGIYTLVLSKGKKTCNRKFVKE